MGEFTKSVLLSQLGYLNEDVNFIRLVTTELPTPQKPSEFTVWQSKWYSFLLFVHERQIDSNQVCNRYTNKVHVHTLYLGAFINVWRTFARARTQFTFIISCAHFIKFAYGARVYKHLHIVRVFYWNLLIVRILHNLHIARISMFS
jgi:hypothetical protein